MNAAKYWPIFHIFKLFRITLFFLTRWKYKWIGIIWSLATVILAYGVVLLKYTKYGWMKGSITKEMFRCVDRREKCKDLVLSNELLAPVYMEVGDPRNVRQPACLILNWWRVNDRWGDHMRDYMDRRFTPSKRVTSSTWGPSTSM